ncbi:MAG: 3-phosphoshikimate 1-carboxyvinyltransferase [Candidatus Gastranaerophilales bacterium]|nr:3-phosphoshikimate 1-carboxyvinyltransferase [Candidatus Gastranaerophilales bacterium]
MDYKTRQAKQLKGSVVIPPDKSISHRTAMFAALSKGLVNIKNYSKGADCRSTLKIVGQLGCEIKFNSETDITINAKNALSAPMDKLDCGNSGTTMRMMAGILAGQPFDSVLFGDVSLSKRPMKRIIEPLTLMGAKIEHNDFKAPLTVHGQKLQAITYNSPIASAQVKSALLIAGMNLDGVTTVNEPYQSRNHTEIMLKYMGADIIEHSPLSVSVRKSEIQPKDLEVVGDISSAAFFMAAAAIVPNSDVTIQNVGINQTRSGMIDVMKRMNADISLLNKRNICGEDVADINVKYSDLKGTVIEGADIPRLIDELPVIAVMATQAEGTTIIRDASDLRNKESDRITTIVNQLKNIGADIEETPDGMIINGKTELKGGIEIDCHHDHRTAMSFYVAGLIAKQPMLIREFEWVNTSFPEFLELMNKICSD